MPDQKKVQSTSWIDSFINQMQQQNAARSQLYNYNPVSTAISSSQIAQSAIGNSMLSSPHTQYAPAPLEDLSGGPNIVSRILDVLQRPLYAVSNLMTEAAKGERNNVWTDSGNDAGKAFVQGLTGERKGTYIDTAKAMGLDDTAAAALGTVANLTLDPANLVYGPAGKLIMKGVHAVTGSEKALKAAEEYGANAVENKPDFLGSSALASGDGAQSAASAVSGGKQSAPSVVDQILKTPKAIEPNPIDFNPSATVVREDGTVIPPPSRQSIDDAIGQVNRKVYQVGSISSPYQAITDELGKVRTEVLNTRNPAAAKAFSDRYKSILDPKDYAALQRVRSPQAFDEVAQNILSKTKPAGLTSVKDFVIAARHGEIPTEDMNSVLDTARVQNLEDLVHKYEGLSEPGPASTVANAVQETATDPLTQAVRVAKDQVATDKPPIQAVLDAAQSDAVKKSTAKTPSVHHIAQGKAIAEDVRNISNNVRASMGQYKPSEQIDEVSRQLYANTKARDSLERDTGITHPVRAYPDKPVFDETNPVPRNSSDTGPIVPQYEYDSLRASNVMDVLGHDLVRKTFVDFKTKLMPTVTLHMAARALDGLAAGMDRFDIAKIVRDTGVYWNNKTPIVYKGNRSIDGVNKHIEAIANQLASRADRLQKLVTETHGIQQQALAKAAGQVADTVVSKITKDLSDATGTVADAVEDLSDVGNLTKKAANGSAPVTDAAGPVIAEDIAKITNEGDIKAAKTLKDNASVYADKKKSEYKAKNETVANAVAQGKVDAKQADIELITTMPKDLALTDQVDIQAAAELNQIAEKKYRPFSSLFASYGSTGRQVAQDAIKGDNAAVASMMRFNNSLGAAMKQFSDEDQRIAFAALQSGQWPEESSSAYAATKAMKPYLELAGGDTSHMGGKAGNPLTGSIFGREYSVEDIHRAFEDQGIKKEYYLPSDSTMEKLRKKDPTKTDRYWIADAYRHVNIDNPVDFIERMFGASRNLANEAAVGTHFSIKWGSSVRKPGYIRLNEELKVPEGSKSRFWQHVMKVDKAGKPIYYPKEAAEWLVNTERVVAASTGFGKAKGPIAKFIQKDLDPLLSVWKTTVTVARPGFIGRNFIGDVMLNFLTGVTGIKAYKDAFQVLKAGGRLNNTTIEMLNTLVTDPSDITAVGKWTGTVHLAGGKKSVINDRAMYTMAHQESVLPTYHMSADVINSKAEEVGTPSVMQNMADTIMSTRYLQFMARATESTSHVPRMAQFVHHMQDPKFTSRFRTVDEAAKAAADNVRKYHPDVTSLSPSGQKYMRRLVPFYTWTRMTIPVIVESLLTRPTTITFVPKIYYGANQMMGGGAASPSELIPPTRLVPNFVRDALGFVGGSATFNLGTPVEALADNFNNANAKNPIAGIVSNAASQLNPFIKAPIELYQGKQINGQPIVDKGEYIDQVLPIVNQLSNITGVSVSGSVADMVSGQGFIDPQRSVQTGNKNYFFNQALLNFLTGAGIANFDKSTYDALAEKQYRQGNL